MRAVVQRVSKAEVFINSETKGKIGNGIVVLLAVTETDTQDIIKWMCNKLVNLRIFPDEEDKMNKSVLDYSGEIMLISNFTVYGDVRKGFRPNFMKSAPQELSEPIYDKMLAYLRDNYPLNIVTGEFGAMMDINLVNAGPVTVIIDKD